jgi:hypothetical protein
MTPSARLEQANLSRSTFLALATGLLASGCMIVPVTTDSYDPDCRVVTHHMELKSVVVSQLAACQSYNCQVEVVAAAGLVTVSLVVSGSIVVVGNVVYWSEHRVSCPPPIAGPAASAAA